MEATFLNKEKSLLTVMLLCEIPDLVIGRVKNALCHGAEAFAWQTELLKPEYRNPEMYRRAFEEMRGKPVYVTNYRSASNAGKSDEMLAEGLLTLADCGATLCDVMGDFYDRQPGELTMDKVAVEKQMQLIENLHEKGAEVLMSSHVLKYMPGEEVLEMALEQKRRGADIAKIVTWADNMDQQLENLKTTWLLKKELGIPFLFLSGGENTIHRRLGGRLGCCMYLCTYEHDALSAYFQPLLSVTKQIRDEMGF